MASQLDWEERRTLSERMRTMLDNEVLFDVTFSVGPEKVQFRAHKMMLISASEVFFRMFTGPLAEKGDVSIPDVDAATFKAILKFIYTDEIEINSENIQKIIYASEKYMMLPIKKKCFEFVNSEIHKDNACTVFQVSHDLNLVESKKKAFNFILENADECLSSQSFLMMSHECVSQIIEADDLSCKEESLLGYLIEWAKVRCEEENMADKGTEYRRILGDLVLKVRFSSMDPTYFSQEVSTCGILTKDEIIDVFRSFHDRKVDMHTSKYPRGFLKTIEFHRCVVDNSNTWGHAHGAADGIDFNTSFDCFLSGIIVFGAYDHKGHYKIVLRVYKGSSEVLSIEKELQCVAEKQLYRIDIEKNVKISKMTDYTIELKMSGPPAYRGKNYTTEVTNSNGRRVTFKNTSRTSPNNTSDNQGQIPGLILRYRKQSRSLRDK